MTSSSSKYDTPLSCHGGIHQLTLHWPLGHYNSRTFHETSLHMHPAPPVDTDTGSSEPDQSELCFA